MHPAQRALPLTYAAAMRDVRALYERVSSVEEASLYGLHSLRVSGYTLAKRGVGEALAVAQGGWHSDAHERYERFSLSQVLDLPAAMLAADSATGAAMAVPVAPVLDAAAAVTTEMGGVPVPGAPTRSASSPRARRRRPEDGQGQVPARPALAPAPVPNRSSRFTAANCVGRRALCPAAMWPSWRCREHEGRGWEVTIDKLRGDPGEHEVQVRFVAGARRWQPMWVQLAALRAI